MAEVGAAERTSVRQQLRAERDAGFRPDIEGLRAIAVVAVLLYHGELGPFDGGYVGVDVFFVVSGFLITRLLIRDVTKSGGRSLPNFWARRARRLLPASALVIVATLIIGWVVLDPLTHRSLGRDALAAALFVVNMVFAGRDGDYFASELDPSPLLHFWSLAVEEQFYVVWPVILLFVVRVRSGRRTALGLTIGLLWAASFVASLVVTERNAPWAFYLLPTRAWELLSGAAVAVFAPVIVPHLTRVTRVLLAWGGLVAIAASMVVLTPATTFPGWAALWPVAATVAVVVAGAGAPGRVINLPPQRLLSTAPMMWIGQRSYGIYLWHWPALVLATAAWGPLDAWGRFAALAVSVGIAAVAYDLFENPIRHLPWLAERPSRGLLTGGALIAGVVAVSMIVVQVPRDFDSGEIAEVVTITVPPTTVVGPSAIAAAVPASTVVAPTTTVDDATDLGDVVEAAIAANVEALGTAVLTTDVPANLRPSLTSAADDKPVIYNNGCMLSDGSTQPGDCIYGIASASTTIVLFGDSHAAQWFPALHVLAEENGWRLEAMTKQGCPTADVPTTRADRDPECVAWRSAVVERLAANPPDLLLMSSYRYNPGGLADEPWRSGLRSTMSELRPVADQVLILGDTPTPVPSDVPTCLAQNLTSANQCIASRSQSVVEGRVSVEREIAREFDALFAATGDWLCTDQACPVIFGDVLLYRDGNHISTTAALLLKDYLEATINAAFTG